MNGCSEKQTSAPLVFVTDEWLAFEVKTELSRKERVEMAAQDSPAETFENGSNKRKSLNMTSRQNECN